MSDQNSSMKPTETQSFWSSLKTSKAISVVRDINEQVMTILLNSGQYMWKEKEAGELVKEYSNTSRESIYFYASLQEYFRTTHDDLLKIKGAIESDEEKVGVCGKFLHFFWGRRWVRKKYSWTLKALENFTAASVPLTKEVFSSCDSITEKIASLEGKLEKCTKKLDMKRKLSKACRMARKGLNVAAVVAEPILTGVVGDPDGTSLKGWAAALPGAVDQLTTKSVASLSESYDKLKLQFNIAIGSMHSSTNCTKERLRTIKEHVDEAVNHIKSRLDKADWDLTDEKAGKSVIHDFKNRLDECIEGLAYLSKLAGEHGQSIKEESRLFGTRWDEIQNHGAAK